MELHSTFPVLSEYNETVESLAARRHFQNAATLQLAAALASRKARDYYRLYGHQVLAQENVIYLQLQAQQIATEARQAYGLAADIDRSAY